MSANFNLGTKKEDLSLRLKVHDIKRAKNETRKLETEGKKMEERLLELKLAMNREKEDRERQGGGFWKSGKQGTLNNYAEGVLTKKKSKSASSGKGKIKILKDKPLDLPERSNQPGTMAYIAQKGTVTPRDKPRGPRCGQCEERNAAVSCMQCAEDYCAGCFAAFHLKGNLKKHRSQPLSVAPRQCFASPRPSPSQSASSYDFQHGDGAVALQVPNNGRSFKKDRNSPEGASGTYETNPLMEGQYNEAEQASAFQDALNAWRTGKAESSNNSAKSDRSPNKAPTPRGATPSRGMTPRGVPYSPVQTPTVNMDCSTGTIDAPQDIEITFNSNLSYAERLLLKKHRRTDVDALFTPRNGDRSARGTPRGHREVASPRHQWSARQKSSTSIRVEEFNDGDFEGEERVDFQALYDVSQSGHPAPQTYKDPDAISIVEVQESMSDPSIEHGMNYKIEEEGQREMWSSDIQNKPSTNQNTFDVKPPSGGKSARRRSAKSRGIVSNADNSTRISSQEDPLDNRMSKSKDFKEESLTENLNSRLLGAKLNDVENEMRKGHRNKKQQETLNSRENSAVSISLKSQSSKSTKQEINSSRTSKSRLGLTEAKNSSESSKDRPSTAKSRPKSAKSRPQTGNRGQSRQGSRPTSRAISRAQSRLDNPGLLTKGPSDGLAAVARMTPTSDTYKGTESLFMVGVQPTGEPEERTLTPTQHKNKDEKIKVSYQLYNMAPRSWKPDFSLADSVPVDNVENEDAEDERASSVMAYHAYSEQMVSDITDRLFSRFDTMPLDEDSMSDHSSGGAHRSLGEEYRNFTPRSHSHSSSVQDSPNISGRGTPTTQMMRPQKTVPTPRRSTQEFPSQTPRQTARSKAQTPRMTSASRAETKTPRRSKTFHEEPERPISRAIVMEGTDLSIFDTMGDTETSNMEDVETLDKLEWELASQSGRLTADGNISRMEIMEEPSDDSLNNSVESFRSLSRIGQDHGYDINSKLRKDELTDDEEEITDDEGDVRNLM